MLISGVKTLMSTHLWRVFIFNVSIWPLFQRDELEQDLKLEILEVRNQLASTEKTMIDDRRKERSSASEKHVLNDRLEECQSKLKKALYENTLFSNRCDVLKSLLDESQSHIESLSSQVSIGDLL